MRLRDAKKLHSGDEVTVKRTKEILRVIETEYISAQDMSNGVPGLSVFLEDGIWYGYKEIC